MNLVFVFGEDSYSSKEFTNKWKEAFIQKHGDFNFSILESNKIIKSENILEQCEQVPFLGEKRMIYLYNFLQNASSEEQKKFSEKINNIPETTILVIVEEKEPDKRLTLFKKLQKSARIEHFPLKNLAQTSNWIQKQFAERGRKINFKHAEQLAISNNNNLWLLNNEIDKLCLFSENEEISNRDLETMTSQNLQTTIFKLTENIGSENKKELIQMIKSLVNSGEDLMFIFHMIVRQIRIITLTQDLLEKGENQFSLAKKLKLPPFAIKNLVNQSKKISKEKIRQLYEKLSETEIGIKTGKIKISKDNQKDLILALEKILILT